MTKASLHCCSSEEKFEIVQCTIRVKSSFLIPFRLFRCYEDFMHRIAHFSSKFLFNWKQQKHNVNPEIIIFCCAKCWDVCLFIGTWQALDNWSNAVIILKQCILVNISELIIDDSVSWFLLLICWFFFIMSDMIFLICQRTINRNKTRELFWFIWF